MINKESGDCAINESPKPKQESYTFSDGNEPSTSDAFSNLRTSDQQTGVSVNSKAMIDQLEINEANTSASVDEIYKIPAPRLTILSTSNGSEVYLIGTSHFSRDSINDVEKIMKSVKPGAVVVELCKDRFSLLTIDENELLEQNRNFSFSTLPNAIAQRGIAQGLIYTLFIKMSATLTQKLGIGPGGEFRVAVAEAKKLQGCLIFLGDRSIKVTIARAVKSLSFLEKIKILYQSISCEDSKITSEEIEKFKNKDILSELFRELAGEYGGLKTVLLDERDIYLAHSIYSLAQRYETSLGPRDVVAVVGVGHVAGIVEHWGKTTDEEVRALNEIPAPSMSQVIVFKIFKYGTLALLSYGIYKTVNSAIHVVPKLYHKIVSIPLMK